MSKTSYKVSNWSSYSQALRERGSLSVWISEEAIGQWKYDGPVQRGAQPVYSDQAIKACLSLRQAQGFIESLFELMELELPAPDYSTLSRRQETVSVDLGPGSQPVRDTTFSLIRPV